MKSEIDVTEKVKALLGEQVKYAVFRGIIDKRIEPQDPLIVDTQKGIIFVNSTANVMRGSLNLAESMKLDKGYKFVWDFATSQANGTISAVALTYKWGGIGYMGDTYDNTNKRWHMKSTGVDANATIKTVYINAVGVNYKGNYICYARLLERGLQHYDKRYL